MKRTLLVVSLSLVASFSFAQKGAVKNAKTAMKNNIAEARELIKPALTNPETKDDSETWKTAGDIEYKAFESEKDKEQLQEFTGKTAESEVMYTGLYNMYEPYIKADELGQLPDEKGKIKNKVRKNIVKALKDSHPFFINGGVYYNDKKEYSRAADFFERYWELPSLPIFHDEVEKIDTQDANFQTIKYYAIISSIQAATTTSDSEEEKTRSQKEHARAIRLLNKINSEPYVQNETYKESDTYELLASEYEVTGDSANYVKTLHLGATKFPKNPYFTPNLINVYIKGGKNQEAIDYLDQAIANDPSNSCDLYSVKASLFAEKKDYAQATAIYNQALEADTNCARSLEGLGVLYILQAQDIKEKATQTTNRKEQSDLDQQSLDLYKQSLPHLEKYLNILKTTKADELEDIRQTLFKLQNVYYNLNMQDQLTDVENQLAKIKEDMLK